MLTKVSCQKSDCYWFDKDEECVDKYVLGSLREISHSCSCPSVVLLIDEHNNMRCISFIDSFAVSILEPYIKCTDKNK